jgi:hypothetical protein
VKRSRSIRLILLGGLSATALTSCAPGTVQPAPVTTDAVYTNNYYLPGVGYYHAPFRAWYALPYNHFDQKTTRYFYGGQWAATPYESAINISAPTPDAARVAEAQRADIVRGGFGSTSGSHWIYS